MSNKRIVILYGELAPDAPQDEQDVLAEVKTVGEALGELGYETINLPLSLNLEKARQSLSDLKPALVFNLVESVNGSGQLIHLAPALLEQMQLPYTGAALTPVFVTSQKTLTKQLLKEAGIATPDWFEIQATPDEQPAPATFSFNPPYIMKSIWEHASIGLDEHSLHQSRESLAQALLKLAQGNLMTQTTQATIHTQPAQSARTSSRFFVEAYIEGREFNLALLDSPQGVEVLPPAEIQFVDFPVDKPKILGYKAKWEEDSFEYRHTQRTFDFPKKDQLLLENLKIIAMQCWRIFNLKGYARVDFRVAEDLQPWVLEINVNPCISPDAGFMAAAGRAGVSRNEVIKRIVQAV